MFPSLCQAVPVWALSLPLPAIIIISVGLYMILLAAVLWCHYCLKVLQHYHLVSSITEQYSRINIYGCCYTVAHLSQMLPGLSQLLCSERSLNLTSHCSHFSWVVFALCNSSLTLQAKCDPQCSDCCAGFSPCEYCLVCAQSCDCRPPSLQSCLDYSCPSPNVSHTPTVSSCFKINSLSFCHVRLKSLIP